MVSMTSMCLISFVYLLLSYTAMVETCMEDCKDKSKLSIKNAMPLPFVTQIPHERISKPLEVYTEVYLEDLNSFRPVTMDFRLDFFLKHHWNVSNNICLRYLSEEDSIILRPNGNFFGPMSGNSVILKAKEVKELWLPDTYIGNSKIVETPAKDSSTNFIVVKRAEKTCVIDFTLRLAAIISCQMDFRSYPVDIQVCPFILRSFSYPKEMVVYVWDQEGPPPFNPEMRMLRHRVSISKGKSEIHMLNMTYSMLYVNLTFERELAHHLIQVFTPSALIVVLSWLSFWLGLEATAGRITLCVTSLLALITQFSSIRRDLPPLSYIHGVDIWMVTCMCFVFASLLEFTVLIKMEKKRVRKLQKATDFLSLASSNHSVSGGHKQIVFNNLDEELGSRNHNLWKSTTITLSAVNQDGGCRDWPQTIDKLSRYFFPMTFLLFNAFYWPILLSR